MIAPRISPARSVTGRLLASSAGLAASATVASATTVIVTPDSPILSHLDDPAPASFDFSGGAISGTTINFGVRNSDPRKPYFGSSTTYATSTEPATSFYTLSLAMSAEPVGDGTADKVSLLGVDTTIDSSLIGAWDTSATVSENRFFSPDWAVAEIGQGFVGFRFQGGETETPLFGWAELAFQQSAASVALLRYGYEDSGAAIQTPSELTPYDAPIPEPASAALGAALAAGSLALLRRRRGVAA